MKTKTIEKFIWLYLIIVCLSFIIFVTTDFTLNRYYQTVLITIETLILTVFSYYLIKSIKEKKVNYPLNSLSAYIGILGINVIIFGLFHFGVVYPLSYALHTIAKKPITIEMDIVDKKDFISSTQYLKKYRYKIWLKDNDLLKVVYLNDEQLSNKDFDTMKLHDKMMVNMERSMFGYTIDRLEFDKPDI